MSSSACHHCWHQDGDPPKHTVSCCRCNAEMRRVPAAQAVSANSRPAPAPAPRHPMRETVAGEASVDDLLKALRMAHNPADKRKLRARLRAAGHTGGLRHG